ncbi:unnamed protein product [Rotaria sp. Silwood2]|nr:unnamed protein product [Rotaria sp. Silwood2]
MCRPISPPQIRVCYIVNPTGNQMNIFNNNDQANVSQQTSGSENATPMMVIKMEIMTILKCFISIGRTLFDLFKQYATLHRH